MNLTKRTLCIIMALAVVFTTLVFVSVGASVDFPIHNTIVSLSGGSNQNCNQSQPQYTGNNKIAYASAEKITIDALISADATNLKTLVKESEYCGEYVSIDLYAEFVSSLDNTRVAASVNFGAGDVVPSIKNTNVTSPTSDHSVDFVNRKIVTLKLWIDDIITGRNATIDDLNSVSITIFPKSKETVTGTFFFSAPYIESEDGENISTVNITSIKTTTIPPEQVYNGNIVVYDSGVKFTGKHNYVQSITGGVTDTKGAKVFYGDAEGFEGQYLHLDGTGQQIQLGETQLEGLSELRQRALEQDKSICIDVYANDFTNGNITYDPKCDLQMYFNGGSMIGGDSQNERKVIRSGIKQTIVFPVKHIVENSSKLSITFQNYSYGDYKSVTNAKFIITAPYLEGDPSSSVFSPTTTSVTTTTVPADQNYTAGGKVTVYDNGVVFNGIRDFKPKTPGTVTVEFGNSEFKENEKVTESEVVMADESKSENESESESTVKTKIVEKNYTIINATTGSWEGNGQQIMLWDLYTNGLPELKRRAINNNESVCIDIYSTGMPSNCYFQISFKNGSGTGDYDRLITNNKKQTLVFSPSLIGDSTTSMNITFKNYSFGSKTIAGKFIVSVPYTKSDFEVPVKNGTTGTTFGQATEVDLPETETTATSTSETTTSRTVNYEEGDLALKIKDSIVTYTGGWSNPEYGFNLASGNKSASVYSAKASDINNGVQYQLSLKTNNLDALALDAISQGKNIAIDLYGNFINNVQPTAKAYARVIMGGCYFGNDPGGEFADNANQFKQIETNKVVTIQINPRTLIDKIKATGNTTAADTSVNQVEDLQYTGNLKPVKTTLDTKEVMHAFSNPSVGDYIEYTIPGIDAGTYNISLLTRDYTNRGKYSIYVNGKLLKDDSFYSTSVVNKEHSVGQYELAEKGDVKVKIVYKEKGEGSGSELYLDGIKVKNIEESTQTTQNQSSDAEIAKNKFTGILLQVRDSGGWTKSSTCGRFYMSVPYIVGASEGEPVKGVTTTTTKSIPTTTGSKFTSVNDIDFGYVDCKFDLADWPANGSKIDRAFGNKVYRIANTGDKQQQIGAKLNVNGGSITKDFTSYVKYAKEAGALLAMDVYPSFSMSDGGSLYCHMNTTWDATGANNKSYEAEQITPNSDVQPEDYIPAQDSSVADDSALSEVKNNTFAKFTDVKSGQVIEYTLGDVNSGTYSINVNAIQNANSGSFNVIINGDEKDVVKFSSDDLKYGSLNLGTYKVAEKGDVTIKLVCKSAGDLIINNFSLTEKSFVWPISNKSFKLTAGQKYTYYIDPYDIPEGSSKFSVYFDSYEYSPGWRAMQNAEIYLTAPYLAGDYDESKTTTTTTATTSTKRTTVTGTTYAYPSNNGGGTTKFYISDVSVAPGGTVRVPVKISGNAGLYSAKFSLKFNPYDLSFAGFQAGNVFDNVFVNSETAADDGIIDIMLQSSSDTNANGDVVYLDFDVSSIEDDYQIVFGGDGGTGYYPSNFFNYSGKNVPCSFKSGYIIVDSTGNRTLASDDSFKDYPTSNSGTTKFTIDSVSENYVAGTKYKDFSVAISVSGNAGLASAKFTVQYDNTKLKFLGSTTADTVPPVFNLTDYNFTPIEYDPGILTYDLSAKDERIPVNSKNNGKIVVMKFRVLNYAVGNYNISFGGESYNEKDFVSLSNKNVPCSFKSGGISIKKVSVGKATLTSVKLSGKTSAKLTWTKAANANSYKVFRALNSSNSFVQIGVTSGTTYTDSKLAASKQYKYKVVAVNSSVSGTDSNIKSVVTMSYTQKPTVKSLSVSKNKINVSLKKKIVGATGYQISYSSIKNFSKSKTKTLTTTSLSKKFSSKLSKNTKVYYVRVRAYNTVNGKKTYGKWSSVSVKKVK